MGGTLLQLAASSRQLADRQRIMSGCTALLLALRVAAQDPQFSQTFAAPMYMNPALAGSTFEDRIALNYRMQWTGLPRGYETYAASYDHNFADANSGFGAFVLRDRSGTAGLAFTHAALNYSYSARINRHKVLRAGIRAGWTVREWDPGSVVFADQVIRDNAPVSIEQNLVESVNYPDVTAGALYHTEKFWFGASFNHINRPQQSLMSSGDVRLPIRTSVSSGYRFAIDGQPYRKAKMFMTGAMHYKAQQKWDQLDLGVYMEMERFITGLWYRRLPGLKAYQPGYPNHESVILMAGFETEGQLRIIYSYDVTVSWLTMRSGGAHEISLQYEWPKRAKNRRFQALPCPKF